MLLKKLLLSFVNISQGKDHNLIFQMKQLHLSYFFHFKLEMETNLSNFWEKEIFLKDFLTVVFKWSFLLKKL